MDQPIDPQRQKRGPPCDFDTLLASANEMESKKSKPNTEVFRSSCINRYEKCMRRFEQEPWPLSLEKLKAYTAYLCKYGGRGGKPATYTTVYTAFSPLFEHNRKVHGEMIKEQFLPILHNILRHHANVYGSGTKKMKVFTEDDIIAAFTYMSSEIEHFMEKKHHDKVLTFSRPRAMFAVGISGLLRCNELLNLRCNDICFHREYLAVTVRKSKTSTSNPVVRIHKLEKYCPVQYLKFYMELGKLSTKHKGFLFRQSKAGERHKLCQKPISANSWRNTIRSIAKNLNLNPETDYGTHSLRRSGATNIIKNGGSSLSVKRLVRWKSDSYERYVEVGSTLREKTSTKVYGEHI